MTSVEIFKADTVEKLNSLVKDFLENNNVEAVNTSIGIDSGHYCYVSYVLSLVYKPKENSYGTT